jgi:hypothetical protein
MTGESRQEQLARLATRLCAGEVVFFIGAGFSLDTEGNSTTRLIARLLARFEALALELSGPAFPERARQEASDLRERLRASFGLKTADGVCFTDLFDTSPRTDGETTLSTTLNLLAQNYYVINDWMCSAFDNLIDWIAQTADPDLARRVNERENAMLLAYSRAETLDLTESLPPMDVAWLTGLHAFLAKDRASRAPSERFVAGKALFLDTLGFNNDFVMGGLPMDPDPAAAVQSADRRVRPRHHVLAWLAAEGLCPTLVTTNYDLLVDSAYRMAGMLPLNPIVEPPRPPEDVARDLRLPLNCRYRHFSRIAEAGQFFTRGYAHGTAVIHKIHGCVEVYRDARRRPPGEEAFALLRKILPTIVFTFREIQNWRDDSWSRDHLTTLLRTRTIVFAGYSGADPVIHDTFRTVYEEVARYRLDGSISRAADARRPGASARAFFTDRGKESFHGLELLRAASVAAGDPRKDLTDHPNLLTFHLENERSFPTVDELFLWTYHLTAREMQAQALEAEAAGIAYRLFGRRSPPEEIAAIGAAFAALRQSEAERAKALDALDPKAPETRRRFERLTRWTFEFHRLLMREYQLADGMLREPTEGAAIQKTATLPWYRPIAEHPQWAAWGVILEMAIRRADAVRRGAPASWHGDDSGADVVSAACPSIGYSVVKAQANEPQVRRVLAIELATLRRRFPPRDERRLFAACRPNVWAIQPETIPWWTETDGRRPLATPCASALWRWCAAPPGTHTPDDADVLLGGGARAQQRPA